MAKLGGTAQQMLRPLGWSFFIALLRERRRGPWRLIILKKGNPMREQLESILQSAQDEILAAADMNQVNELRVKYLGQ